jgi:hypothetical protein
VVGHVTEILHVELKGLQVLDIQLVHTIQEHQKNGSLLIRAAFPHGVPRSEVVAGMQPFFLDQNCEPIQCPEIGVNNQLDQAGNLAGSVPAV